MKYIAIPLLLLLFSCNPNRVYEAYQDLPQMAWLAQQNLDFEFQIDNPDKHQVFYHIRYTPAYQFYNLYVEYQITDSTQKPLYDWQRQDINLMHPETGVPLGKGVANFFDVEQKARDIKFPYKGKYHFRIRQFMRKDTLQQISAVGLRIEKISP